MRHPHLLIFKTDVDSLQKTLSYSYSKGRATQMSLSEPQSVQKKYSPSMFKRFDLGEKKNKLNEESCIMYQCDI